MAGRAPAGQSGVRRRLRVFCQALQAAAASCVPYFIGAFMQVRIPAKTPTGPQAHCPPGSRPTAPAAGPHATAPPRNTPGAAAPAPPLPQAKPPLTSTTPQHPRCRCPRRRHFRCYGGGHPPPPAASPAPPGRAAGRAACVRAAGRRQRPRPRPSGPGGRAAAPEAPGLGVTWHCRRRRCRRTWGGLWGAWGPKRC